MKRMKYATPFLTLAAAALLAAPASACPNCKKDHKFGPTVPVGNGMAFSWVRLDKKTNKPVAMGVTMTETALDGLPFDMAGPMPTEEHILDLPKGISGINVNHVGLNWNPKGHIPKGVYDTPHFDFHFYLMTEAQVAKITNTGAGMARCMKHPAAKYIPAGYILPPGTTEPRMGAHWIHPGSRELNGLKFDATFIYGTYDGKINFLEPMITKEYLERRLNVEMPIPQPKAYRVAGYYPTKYRIGFNADRREFSISLEGLVYRKAG